MRKKICFLLSSVATGFISLCSPNYAMEPTLSSPEISGRLTSKLNQIRAHYNLLPSNDTLIPTALKTGHGTELEPPPHPCILNNGPVDLMTVDFYQVLMDNPLTPFEIDQFVSSDQWQEFLQVVQENGNKIKVNGKGVPIGTEKEDSQSVETALRQQARWQFAKIFMHTLQQALKVIPASLYQHCPASLIVDHQFSVNDGAYDLAIKYERVGLKVKDLDEKISLASQHMVMGEAFAQAGEYFEIAADQSTDVFLKPDLYISAGICSAWSAMHCDPGKAELTLKSGREAIQKAYKSLSVAYAAYRQLLRGEVGQAPYTPEEMRQIKEQLAIYPVSLVSWSQKFDPDFYQILVKHLGI